jgi:hypothetical protein
MTPSNTPVRPVHTLLGLATCACLAGPAAGAGAYVPTYTPSYPVVPVPYYPVLPVPVYTPGYPPVRANPYLPVPPIAVPVPAAPPAAKPAEPRAVAANGAAGNNRAGAQANGKGSGNGKPEAQANAQAPDLTAMIRSFGQFFSEEEIDLLYDYLRDTTLAALKGDEEVLLPPDLAFKLEVLQQRMKKEGAFYFQNLIRQMERDLDRALQDYRSPPPPPPYELPQYRGSTR